MCLDFEPLEHFVRALGNQEEASSEEDEVARRDRVTEHGEEIRGQTHDPREAKEQTEAHEERQRKAQRAGCGLLMRGQLVGREREKDDVVDAEYDFEASERRKAGPAFGMFEDFERTHGLRVLTRARAMCRMLGNA